MELGIKVEKQGAFIQWGMEEAMLQLSPHQYALAPGEMGLVWVSGTPSVCFNPAPACPQLLEVNKQWDQHFRSMKQQYEQKVMEFLGAEPRMAQGGGMRGFYPD